MADVSGTVAFRALAAQAGAVLLTRGMEVEPVAVRGVAAHLVRAAAAGSGMDEEEAVGLVTAEAVADAIVRAVEDAGTKAYHGVRPVRPEKRTVPVALPASGRLVMAAAQAARYAVANEDRALAEHLLDLATEIGAALSGTGSGAVAVEVGVLDELARLLEDTAERIEESGWSICPCGEDHGQREVDQGVASSMRADAALARSLRHA